MTQQKESFKFWEDFDFMKQLLFDESHALGEDASREIVAGIDSDRLSVEVNVYGVDQDYIEKTGRYGILEYYVCECTNGDWGSLAELDYIANMTSYDGIVVPTVTPETTEEELKQEMSEILTQLLQLSDELCEME